MKAAWGIQEHILAHKALSILVDPQMRLEPRGSLQVGAVRGLRQNRAVRRHGARTERKGTTGILDHLQAIAVTSVQAGSSDARRVGPVQFADELGAIGPAAHAHDDRLAVDFHNIAVIAHGQNTRNLAILHDDLFARTAQFHRNARSFRRSAERLHEGDAGALGTDALIHVPSIRRVAERLHMIELDA